MSKKFIKIGADIIDINQIASIAWRGQDVGTVRLKNSNHTLKVYGNMQRAIELFRQLTEGSIYEAK